MDKAKSILSILKDGFLLILFLLLLFFPAAFNRLLERAGFTEGSFMGFTWKQKAIESRQVADSSQQLALNASLQLQAMQNRLDSISRKLTAMPQSSLTSEISASIDSSKTRVSHYNLELKRGVKFQTQKLNTIFK